MDPQAFVRWFRHASPYIHTHRGQTFVLCFDGAAVDAGSFLDLIHDIALLQSLGIRVVMVHGARHQIEKRLTNAGISPRYETGLRVTDNTLLTYVKEAVGVVRIQIEALLSMGIANSPMAGARIRVATGNFVTAQPIGVRNGVDFGYTGEVRRVDGRAINEKLDNHEVVLISPLGYSPTGEVFNLSAHEVACAVAIELKAGKLIQFTEHAGLKDPEGSIIRQITEKELTLLMSSNRDYQLPELYITAAACRAGIPRVHLIDHRINGALLLELFTRDGIGTLISAAPFDSLRIATIDDVAGILELITPLEKQGGLVRRSREKLELEIAHFTVLVRDDAIIGCIALYPYPQERIAELACLAVHTGYQNAGWAQVLFNNLAQHAKSVGIERLFVLTTKTAHWFLERGFAEAKLTDLPISRQQLYNYQRNSKAYIYELK